MSDAETLRREYEQVNENFRALADIRFRLLATVPPVGAVAAYLLTRLAEQHPDHPLVLVISGLGFVVTLGVTFYDLRNSQLYDALFNRAQELEAALKLSEGQFTSRPKRTRRLLFIRVGHDPGLALIYAPVLGMWFFPMAISISSLLGSTPDVARTRGLYAVAIATVVFLEEFLRLDGVWRRLIARFRRPKGKSAA